MKHIIVGTAGHIDHGKTTLIKALTGIDTDRLKEEKERGISIELGFAHLALGEDISIGIVDVPGHERFIKTMLAGVGGIDLVILVIAADEGVMPQTREHLHICQLLGIQRGLVALTKRDLVDPEWLDLVAEEVREFLKGTFLGAAPVIPVSTTTGEGIATLTEAIKTLTSGVSLRRADGLMRLPIDRVFTIRGFGTVVTGTLWSGTIRVGDEVVILPAGLRSRVRRLQVHGENVAEAIAGQRTAVNLPGIEVPDINRGDLLCLPGSLFPSQAFDATLTLLPDAPRPLTNRARVRFHLGTAEILARVVLLDRTELKPGDGGYVHLRLETQTAALAHDRYVLRRYSPPVTIGGGVILNPISPPRRRRRPEVLAHLQVLEHGTPQERLEALLREAGGTPIALGTLQALSDLGPGPLGEEMTRLAAGSRIVRFRGKEGETFLHQDAYQNLKDRILEVLKTFHGEHPLKEGMAKEELKSRAAAAAGASLFTQLLQDLATARQILQDRERVRLFGHQPRLKEEEAAAKERLEELFRRAVLQPPALDEALRAVGGDRKVAHALFFQLVGAGTLVKITDDLYIHRDSYERARTLLLDYLEQHPAISVPAFKDLLGITRRHAIPYLEHFDQSKLTRRQGDDRVLYHK